MILIASSSAVAVIQQPKPVSLNIRVTNAVVKSDIVEQGKDLNNKNQNVVFRCEILRILV